MVKFSKDDTTHPWRKRWAVVLLCRDCESYIECANVDPSVELVGGFNRVFLAAGPEVCPKCKNLKAADNG